MDNFYQSPVTTNTLFTNKRRITSDILGERLRGLKFYSTINDSAYYNSDRDDAESDPKSDQLVDTHTSEGKKRLFTDTDTTNGNFPQNY